MKKYFNEQESKVYWAGKLIGVVYLSTHGVWVAEPNFSIYSKSFKTQEEATEGLCNLYNSRNA